MISESIKNEVIQRIVESDEFRNNKGYSRLLLYIFEQNQKGIIPKESAIAIDFFNKDFSSGSKNNSPIRVYIHNLRKKLEHYYSAEGEKDSVRISIPKGKYFIEFTNAVNKDKTNLFKRISILLTFSLLIVSAVFIFREFQNSRFKSNKSEIWKPFLNDKGSVLIIVGDYYLFMDSIRTGRTGLIRDFRVNSDYDFDTLLASSNSYISKTEHTFLTKLAAECIADIVSLLNQFQIPFEIKLASKLQFEDIKNRKTIYLGSYKTLYILKEEFDRYMIEYDNINNQIFWIDQDNRDRINYKTTRNIKPGIMTDHASVIITRNINNDPMMFFISHHDIGVISSVTHFINSIWIKEFEEKYQDSINLTNFRSVFEVQGYGKTDFTSELMQISSFKN